jgi:hypothetical protein
MIVIGNGESRKSIELSSISRETVACNAVVRDSFVNHLICVDRRMVIESINNHSSKFDKIYTRSNWVDSFKDPKVNSAPHLPYTGNQRWDDSFHWGSGPYAVLLAAGLSNIVEMIGFDLWSETKFVNNCYKDTENYDPSNKRAVDPRYWIHQIGRVFECFPQTEFTIYQTPDWQLPEKWNCTNVQVDKISNFTYT